MGWHFYGDTEAKKKRDKEAEQKGKKQKGYLSRFRRED